MSIEIEIDRIVNAKHTLHDWIAEQGVTVPETSLLSDLVALLPLVDATAYEGVKMLLGISTVINGEIQVPGVVVDERDIHDGFKGAIAICSGSPVVMLCLTSGYGQTTNSSASINVAALEDCTRFSDYVFYWCIDPDQTAFAAESEFTVISFWRA